MGTLQQSIVNNVPFCGEFLHYGDKKNDVQIQQRNLNGQVYVARNGCPKRH
jgi:hypothetical protein